MPNIKSDLLIQDGVEATYLMDASVDVNNAPDFDANEEVIDTVTNRNVTETKQAPVRDFVYGKTRKGGVVVYESVTGEDGKYTGVFVDNRTDYLNQIIAWHHTEVEEIEELYLDNVLAWSNNSGSPLYKNQFASNGTSSSTSNYFYHEHRVGTATQSTVDIYNDNAWPFITSDQYTRLLGIAYSYVRFFYNQTIYPNSAPNVVALIKGRKVYDPREVGHSITDATTWEWSDNPVLCLFDYLRDSELGAGIDASLFDEAQIETAATYCDNSVVTDAGGLNELTRNRYSCDGVLSTGDSVKNNILKILSTMHGKLLFLNGKFQIIPRQYTNPHHTHLTEDMIVGKFYVSNKNPSAVIYNRVTGSLVDKDAEYVKTEYQSQSSLNYQTSDRGAFTKNLDLPMTTDSVQAQRLARMFLNDSRRERTIKTTINARGLDYTIGDNISVTNSKLGIGREIQRTRNASFNDTDDWTSVDGTFFIVSDVGYLRNTNGTDKAYLYQEADSAGYIRYGNYCRLRFAAPSADHLYKIIVSSTSSPDDVLQYEGSDLAWQAVVGENEKYFRLFPDVGETIYVIIENLQTGTSGAGTESQFDAVKLDENTSQTYEITSLNINPESDAGIAVDLEAREIAPSYDDQEGSYIEPSLTVNSLPSSAGINEPTIREYATSPVPYVEGNNVITGIKIRWRAPLSTRVAYYRVGIGDPAVDFENYKIYTTQSNTIIIPNYDEIASVRVGVQAVNLNGVQSTVDLQTISNGNAYESAVEAPTTIRITSAIPTTLTDADYESYIGRPPVTGDEITFIRINSSTGATIDAETFRYVGDIAITTPSTNATTFETDNPNTDVSALFGFQIDINATQGATVTWSYEVQNYQADDSSTGFTITTTNPFNTGFTVEAKSLAADHSSYTGGAVLTKTGDIFVTAEYENAQGQTITETAIAPVSLAIAGF